MYPAPESLMAAVGNYNLQLYTTSDKLNNHSSQSATKTALCRMSLHSSMGACLTRQLPCSQGGAAPRGNIIPKAQSLYGLSEG